MNATGWLLPAGTLRRAQLIGFVSASTLAIAGVGAGAVLKAGSHDAIASELHLLALRENSDLRTLCATLSYLSLLGLLLSWAMVGRHLRELTTRHVLILAATWALPLLIAPPLFSADIYAYAGQGHLVVNHQDPYVHGPGSYEPTSKWSFNVDGVWRYSPAPYGPLWLWLAGQAVGLPGDNHLVVSIYLIRGLAVVGLGLLAWSLKRLADATGTPPQRALWLVVCNPLLLLHGVAGAHNDLLMLGLMAAGLMIARRRPDLVGLAAAAAVVTLAALIKAPALIALPFVPLVSVLPRPRWLTIAVTAVSSAITAVGVTAATGLGWGWVGVVGDQGGRPSLWSLAWGLRRLLANAGSLISTDVRDAVDTIVMVGLTALLGVLLVVLWGRALVRRTSALTATGGALLLVFCLSFSEQPWYLAWALTPLSVTHSRRRTAFLAGFSGALCIYLAPGGRAWIRPPWFGVPVVIAALIGLAVAHWMLPAEQSEEAVPGYAEVAVG
ncbi:MAG: hypothetical protein JWO22_230 [Frankiales bacterium]|nr:hypothetical protein [Frankiales bacterium]